MSGTYSNINFGESVTPSFSKGDNAVSRTELAKAIQAGLKKPAVGAVANHKRMADAFKYLNKS